MKTIEDLLRQRIGLDAAALGPLPFQRAVRAQMKLLGLKKVAEYQRLVKRSPEPWLELVESVVVGETWFFRDPQSFAALVRLVLGEWLPAHPASPLRLLSVPCASGEEPYSMAMALLEAGLPPARFYLDAADLSPRALARASRGVYGKNSFRGEDLEFRRRFFQPAQEGYVLEPAVRHCVHFCQGNLLSPNFLAGKNAYDFIFCRNLLIYFDRHGRHKALARIEQLLAPAGVLFVSPAEQPLALAHGFVSAHIPGSFACRKPARPSPLSSFSSSNSDEESRTRTKELSPKPRCDGEWAPPPARFLPADLEQARRLTEP